MLQKKSDKINDFIKQAASIHVLNTVYFLGLVVVALFSYPIISTNQSNILSPTVAGYVLLLTFLFKVAIQNIPYLLKQIEDHKAELVVTTLNVVATYLLLSPFVGENSTQNDFFVFLQSFVPTLMFILITPISWKNANSYLGFYGFLQWAVIIGVIAWSGLIIISLFESNAWFSLASNTIVLVSPFFLSMIRKKQMERLRVSIYEEIYQDPLTEIPNRKCFYEHYDEVREINKKSSENFDGYVVFFVDIDYFKLFNDSYGHKKGDECLKEVAQYLKSLAQSLGLSCFRYGGEEFILAGLKTNKEWEELQNNEVIANWTNGDMSLPIKHERSPLGVVTLSAGASFVVPSVIYENNAGAVTKLADQYLYKSKKSGRSKLTIAGTYSILEPQA
ncbi:MAG: hypothetical protein CBC55_03615 [Gammaproteobacteria bacterium TMED95]|nr:MAG: hypothetical protein CBC55_03615 [Gammaproteobacteria bacterium TMED95]|tara:strand:- start:561 stop:1730 length:1170 start_codon:yes stop_codon:yes gene_type:complete